MKQLKCDNCGATIEITDENNEFATCPYCKAKYQLNERKDIYIRMDDNTKEILTNGFNLFNKRSKMTMIPMIIVFIIIFITVLTLFINTETSISKTSDDNNNISENNTNDTINKIKDKVSKSSFNSKFEIRSGTKYKSSIEYLLDDVITNNKTNKDMLVAVIYKDNETTDPDTIIDIKHSLDKDKKYEVKLDYDEEGYVNKITIEDI